MDSRMRVVFFLFLGGYTGVYVRMLDLQVRLERLCRPARVAPVRTSAGAVPGMR
jgi:hypothetical protein